MRKKRLYIMRNIYIALLLLLSLTVRPAFPQDIYRGSMAATPAGEPLEGFALSLTTRESTVRLGSPILVTVELRNASGNAQHALFGSRHSNYDFKILNLKTGSVVAANSNNAFGLVSVDGEGYGWPIQPRTSIYGPFRLDLLYQFREPGTYSVEVTRGQNVVNGKLISLRSNTIRITVLP